MTPFVSGLLLAAGTSSRFGQPKQLLAYRDTTLVGWTVREALRAKTLSELVVVLGGASDEVMARVDLSRARVVTAADFASGCAASYRTGVAALDPQADAVAVLLGDQPGVGGATIDLIVQTWRDNPRPILVSSYRGRLGHPMIFDRTCFPDLSGLTGDKAAWHFVETRRDLAARVELDLPYPPDVNTPDDYARLVAESPSYAR